MAEAAKPKPEEPEPAPKRLIASANTQFKKDVKLQKKRGKDLRKLEAIIEALCSFQALEARHRDHGLIGPWKGWRDCHVEPDWILIYRQERNKLLLARTGTHSDVF